MPASFPLSPDSTVTHVDVSPGGEIVLHGSYTSKHDGSIVDAATTTWPADAPGGASADAGGLIDFEAGGFHMTSRDTTTHEVHAIATGDAAPACATAGVAAPCLVVRSQTQALSRLMTRAEWTQSLVGGISVDVVAPPMLAPPPAAVPYLQVSAAIVVAGLVGFFAWRRKKRIADSPSGRFHALAKRVQRKLESADPVLAAPLSRAVKSALDTLRERRVDLAGPQGQRIAAVLTQVELRIDESILRVRADQEQEAADELVHEIESALEAADEATLTMREARETTSS